MPASHDKVSGDRIYRHPAFASSLPKVTNSRSGQPSVWEQPCKILRDHPGEPALMAVFEQGHPQASAKALNNTMQSVVAYVRRAQPTEVWTFHKRTDETKYNHRELWGIYHGFLNEEQADELRAVRRAMYRTADRDDLKKRRKELIAIAEANETLR